MINKFLITLTLIFLTNCATNPNYNSNSNDNKNFSYNNNYVSCSSSNYNLYNSYYYQASEYNFRCQNPWKNNRDYNAYYTKNQKWVNTFAKK